MADNRDPRKKSRTRRQLRTSSSDRSKRSKASAKDTPRPTSSTDRAKQQGKASKKVTSDTQRTRTGSAKVTSAKTRTTPKGRGSSSSLRSTLVAGAATALSTGALRNPVSRAKKRESDKKKAQASKSEGNYNTRDADGTVRSRKKVGPKKVGEGKVGTVAQAFDKAYASAKKAGKKTFTFKGKSYSTK